MNPRPSLTAISLFSGVGGLDEGVQRAGFTVRAALEYEADAASSLRANHFPSTPSAVIESSIVDVPTASILEVAGLRPGEVDLVFGGPPCTPFSKSGYWLEYKRKGLDPNASLLDEYARVVIEARPRAALLENVHGLAYRNHNEAPFQRLLGMLQEAGYSVRSKVLNAADYGVPQLRKRLFIYATRDDSAPDFLAPTHSGWTETSRRIDPTRTPYVTSRDVIGDLEFRDDLAEPGEVVGGRYGHLLAEVPPGDNYLYFTEKRGHPEPLFRWRGRYWTFLLKLDPDRPATTIQSQPGPYIGPFHWNSRRLRILEIKRLQTFPDDYVVIGNRRSAQVQLGNAVPPKLAETVAGPLFAALSGGATSLAPEQLVLGVA
jgi:DNA (cytosine-5)-methyltransferase 1